MYDADTTFDRYDDRDEAEYAPRRRRYSCGGFASYNGPCGATDCRSCYPDGGQYEAESEAEERTSKVQVKVVTARKARPALGIKVGDKVRVTSSYTYQVNGPRTGYTHSYVRVAKGPGWNN